MIFSENRSHFSGSCANHPPAAFAVGGFSLKDLPAASPALPYEVVIAKCNIPTPRQHLGSYQ
jgi:hypothetical protein